MMPSASPREGSGSPETTMCECRSIAMSVTVNVNAFGLGRQIGLELFGSLFFFLRIFAVRCSWKWKGKLTQVNAEHALLSCVRFLSFLLAVDLY